MEVLINGKLRFVLNCSTGDELKQYLHKEFGLNSEEYYLLSYGKRIEECQNVVCNRIHVVPRVFGGKGGFGSMLRAIGAQIEKTTNREACRDLSGRRLRDINEEQRLKNWINQQAEREKEAKERKQKKLERLCEIPKHEFKDEQYDKERSELPEAVEDAVLHGLQASCSTKRKITEKKPVVKKKKPKLWVDSELEDDLSSSGEEDKESDSEENKNCSNSSKASESNNSNSTQGNGELNTLNCVENSEAELKEDKVVDGVENGNSEQSITFTLVEEKTSEIGEKIEDETKKEKRNDENK